MVMNENDDVLANHFLTLVPIQQMHHANCALVMVVMLSDSFGYNYYYHHFYYCYSNWMAIYYHKMVMIFVNDSMAV